MKNVNLICPINQLGYGQVSFSVFKYLSKKTNLSLFPLGQIDPGSEEYIDLIKLGLEKAQLFDKNAPSIKIWHQNDMALSVGNGLRIGFPIFELNKFSNIEKHHLESLDKIFVASNWAKEKILDNINISSENVHIIRFGCDFSVSRPINKKSTTTKFFTCGKWEYRKGHDFLVEVFNKAFTENDNVELHLMCTNPFLPPEAVKSWEGLYRNSKLSSKIFFVPRVKSHAEVINIMQSMDCGVFLSRAEGWNLELFEMICCGKPVIATNYSAHTEYCNENNANLIDINSLEPAYDGFWFNGKIGEWANLGKDQLDQAVEYMRNIHKNYKLNMYGWETTRKQFTWEKSVGEILNVV